MEEKLFNVVFLRDNEVVGSQVFYESKIEDVYKKLKSYISIYKSNHYIVFEFDNTKKEYIKIKENYEE